jgi:hypothetical protein
VGTYEIHRLSGPGVIALTVTLEDGGLKLSIAGGPGQPMTPLSETSFTGFGGRVEFGKDENGEVTHLMVRLAEGDFRANRKK